MSARGRSTSPTRYQQNIIQKEEETTDAAKPTTTHTTTTTITTSTTVIPVNRNTENEEPIRLSKFSGGYQPDPETPRKIESLDWPAPPYPAAVPELRARSRSSSNRRAPSTITSVHGDGGDEEDDSDDDSEAVDNEVKVLTNGVDVADHSHNLRQSTGVASVTSSIARAKASRPNSKLRYQNNLFDNDYDDYLMRYKSDKEWRRMFNRTRNRNQSGENNETIDDATEHNESGDRVESPPPPINAKLQREIDEISKIETESSMAAALLNDLKAHQKVISRKLKIDPWKASRTPSAREEPSIRTRFESPVHACKCFV
jgi:hypothetical protein